MSKKKDIKNKEKEVIESFNNAKQKQKEDFIISLEKALKFNPKKK